METIFFIIDVDGNEITGTINLKAVDLFSVITTIKQEYPTANVKHYHIIGHNCDCGN